MKKNIPWRLALGLALSLPGQDRHPDHGRAHRLVRDAAFYAGLVRRGNGAPHRPGAVFSYMQHHRFAPSFVVDVTAAWKLTGRSVEGGRRGSRRLTPCPAVDTLCWRVPVDTLSGG